MNTGMISWVTEALKHVQGLNKLLQLSRLWDWINLQCFYAVYFSDTLMAVLLMDILCKGTAPLRFILDVVQFTESKIWFWINFRHTVKQLSWSLLSEFSPRSMERVQKPANFPGRGRHICPLEAFTNTYFPPLTIREIWHSLSGHRLLIHLKFRYRLGGVVHSIYLVSALQTRERPCVL